jgi:NACalpha-BTF3-like transcription factor
MADHPEAQTLSFLGLNEEDIQLVIRQTEHEGQLLTRNDAITALLIHGNILDAILTLAR